MDMYIYIFFGVSSSRKKKKKFMCEKRKKKMVQNWLGYCPIVSQYNERLYRDTAVMGVQWLDIFIATWGSWLRGKCVTIHLVYCDKDECWLGEDCVAIHLLYCDREGGWIGKE